MERALKTFTNYYFPLLIYLFDLTKKTVSNNSKKGL